jgi:ElaB/YqjD/DUF883 family membrane-anchored ribosome-binding protein
MNQTAHETKAGSAGDMEQFRDEMRQLRQDIKNIGNTLSRVTDSASEKGKEYAQEEFDKLYDEFQSAYGDLKKRGRRTRASLEREIEEYPLTSLAGALVVGLVLGKLFSSSR